MDGPAPKHYCRSSCCVKYETIEQYDHLVEFCGQLSQADTIAFDTEFVSEDTYYPELCLIQVASQGRLAIIDPRGSRCDPLLESDQPRRS